MVVLPFYYCFGTSLLHTHFRVNGSLVINNRFAFRRSCWTRWRPPAAPASPGAPPTRSCCATPPSQTPVPGAEEDQQAGGKLPNPFIQELRAASTPITT